MAAFFSENQRVLEESVFLTLPPEALLVDAQDGEGLPFVFSQPGPCTQLRRLTNIALDLSAAATGCRSRAECAISLGLAMPAPGTCASFPGPFQTIYLIPGFSCQ